PTPLQEVGAVQRRRVHVDDDVQTRRARVRQAPDLERFGATWGSNDDGAHDGSDTKLERQTVRNAPEHAANSVEQRAHVGRSTAEFTSAGRGGASRPYETRLERRSVEPIGVLERQTVRNAPRYAENCVGQSARVGRGPAEFTSAGRGGASRPYETRLERRSVEPIGV